MLHTRTDNTHTRYMSDQFIRKTASETRYLYTATIATLVCLVHAYS